jgi:AcrR family transcriptional regulator
MEYLGDEMDVAAEMGGDFSKKRGSAKRASSREAILETAEALFAAHGYYGTSTHDVAAQTGVKQSLIAYHFGSKEKLYREIIARHAVAFSQLKLDGLERLLTGGDAVTLEAILDAFIRPVLDQFRPGPPGRYRAYARLLGQGAHLARSPTLHEHYDQVYAEVVRTYRQAILTHVPGMTEDAVRNSIDFLHGAVGSMVGAGSVLYIGGFVKTLEGSALEDAAFEHWIAKLVAFSAAGCRRLAAAGL